MGRVQLSEAIFSIGANGVVSVPGSGGSVGIYERGGTALVTIYAGTAGTAVYGNPRPISNGYAAGYVDAGSYDIVATIDGRSSGTIEWEASRADSVVTESKFDTPNVNRLVPAWNQEAEKIRWGLPGRLGVRQFGIALGSSGATNAAKINDALDEIKDALATVDALGDTPGPAILDLDFIGYCKTESPLIVPSNTTFDGQGDRTILQLTGAEGAGNCNVIQSESWGDPSAMDRGIHLRNFRILGNKAGQEIRPVQAYIGADTAVSTTPTTVPYLGDLSGVTEFPAYFWSGYMVIRATGKTTSGLGGDLTGVTLLSGTDTVRKGSWLTPFNAQGHGIALQATRCHVRAYITDCAGSGIAFQGPDPYSTGLYAPENLVQSGTRVSSCEGYGIEVGCNAPDGHVADGAIPGPDNKRGPIIVRSNDWMIENSHPVGTWGSKVSPVPQGILIAASSVKVKGYYFDTLPGTGITFDTAIQGWTNVNNCQIAFGEHFQSGWGVIGGSPAILFRGIKNHGNVARAQFFGANLTGPISYGFQNAPGARTVGVQNFAAPTNGKIQVRSTMNLAFASAVYGPILFGSDTIEYTGKQECLTKLTQTALAGDTTLHVENTEGLWGGDAFDASGTICVMSENGSGTFVHHQLAYTSKTATTFVLAAPLAADILASGERGCVSQFFLTGCTGGATTSKADGSSGYVDAQTVSITEDSYVAPIFRTYQNDMFSNYTPGPVVAGVAGGLPMSSDRPSVRSASYASTVTPNVPNTDILEIGALTGDITIANPANSTPVDGQGLRLRLSQDGVGGRTITWGSQFAFGTDMTTAMIPTAANAKWEMAFRWHAGTSKWRCTSILRGF